MDKKSVRKVIYIIAVLSLFGVLCGCKRGSADKEAQSALIEDKGKSPVVIGFSQVGAESDWRSANTIAIKDAFTPAKGYELIYEDAQQKQINQITAIRSFIQQEVDFIILAPVTETGWETVLEEAKEARIPVILIDRRVDVSDESLYSCWIGSDFEMEGRKVCSWLENYINSIGFSPQDVHIVNIQGTIGSSAQIGRTKGFEDSAKLFGWDVVAKAEGDFTRSKGKEAMFDILRTYNDVNVVYCENDNEALGVIDALEASGKTPGIDIANGEVLVLSFDGVNKEAREKLSEGKIACIGQCNCYTGDRVELIIRNLLDGEEPYKYQYVEEELFSGYDRIKEIMVGGKKYKVTVIEE